MLYGMSDNLLRWLLSNDTGMSSKTLCACFFNIPTIDNCANYPGDPGDFGRCYRFLALLTNAEKEQALQKVAKISLVWEALVREWDMLEKMYRENTLSEMFNKMQIITRDVLLQQPVKEPDGNQFPQ
jgi:hypothetical protein